MKILFLSDNFYPEVNAPANRTYDHCREWVKLGADVTVITCVPNFPKGKVFEGYKNKLIQTQIVDGIRVVRVWSYITANEGTIKRILDYVSFAITSFFASLFYKADFIIATSPQFFTAMAGRAAGFFKRTPWIMEVRDIWPESIVAVGAMKKSRSILFLEKIEKYLYRTARKIVVVTDSFKQNIIDKGINGDKIYIIKNGVYLNKFFPIPKDEIIVKELGLNGKFVVAYFGTHGMAHKLDFVLHAAKNITDKSIHILLIGDGAERKYLLQLKDQLHLENLTMLASVSKDEIQKYISVIDVALVNLRKSDTFKSVIPSKIFENAAMLKPILLGVEGESKALIEDYNAGICFEPENENEFLEALGKMKSDTELYREFQKGCERLAHDFDRSKLAKKMLEEIQKGNEKWKVESE
jgi:glycosyltransferase involved in cell wall biosynthesis